MKRVLKNGLALILFAIVFTITVVNLMVSRRSVYR